MPITKLIVGGFKSLAQPVEIPIAPITLMFGPNSAGKSTVKDALLTLKSVLLRGDSDVSAVVAMALAEVTKANTHAHILSELDEDGVRQTLPITLGCQVEMLEATSTEVRNISPQSELALDLLSQTWDQQVEYWFTTSFSNYRNQIHLSVNSDEILNFFDHEMLQVLASEQGRTVPDLYSSPHDFGLTPGCLTINLEARPFSNIKFQRLVEETLAKLINAGEQDGLMRIFWVEGKLLNIRCVYVNGHFQRWDPRKSIRIAAQDSDSDVNLGIQWVMDVINELLYQVEYLLAQDVSLAFVPGSRSLLTIDDVTTDDVPLDIYSDVLSSPSHRNGSIASYARWLGLKSVPSESQPSHLLEKLNEKDDLVNDVLKQDLFFGRRYQVRAEVTERTTRVLVGREPTEEGEEDCSHQTTLYLQDQHGRNLNFDQVGSGVSFVLPVLTALWGAPYSWIEQPELHLHPAAQSELGDAVIKAFNRGRFSVIETHSEHMLLRILKRIRQTSQGQITDPELRCQPEAVAVLYFDPQEDGSTQIHHLRVSRGGDFLDRWPRGFFEEREAELFDE